jgi:hypothetical protein
MINKVATTHCSFLRRQIKREDTSTNAVSVTKTELYTILRDVCIVSRDVCIVSNRLTCIDAKLSETEILAQPLSLPFLIENLNRTYNHSHILVLERLARFLSCASHSPSYSGQAEAR